MTVKTAVSLTDQHHDFAKKKVSEGSFASVSSLVAAGIETMIQNEAERQAAIDAMKTTIARRMETPKDQWIEVDDSDRVFEDIRDHLTASNQ